MDTQNSARKTPHGGVSRGRSHGGDGRGDTRWLPHRDGGGAQGGGEQMETPGDHMNPGGQGRTGCTGFIRLRVFSDPKSRSRPIVTKFESEAGGKEEPDRALEVG